MSYTELTVWTRGIIMDKEGRDVVNSVAMAGRMEGKYTQAMENYVDNPDRTNAPTRKYCRLSDSEIENALTYENEHPNIVVLVEGTMVKGWDYMRGMPPGGTLVINTQYLPSTCCASCPVRSGWLSSSASMRRSWRITSGCTIGSASWGWIGCRPKGRPSGARRSRPTSRRRSLPPWSRRPVSSNATPIEPMITNQAAFRAGWEQLQVMELNATGYR